MASLTAKERAALPDSAFAYVDSSGQRRLPIHDAAHVRAALSRFGRTQRGRTGFGMRGRYCLSVRLLQVQGAQPRPAPPAGPCSGCQVVNV